MAAVEVMISGVLYDKYSRTARPVMLVGEASLVGLGVGGGPIIPPGSPPGIWGPTDPRPGWGLPGEQPHPEHPIFYPPGIWGPNDPRPGWGLPGGPGMPPVIVVPKPPEGPPQQPDEPKPPTENNGWGWHPAYGWGYFPPNQAVPK